MAQIDHSIITRAMEWYVLESKHIHAGIKITEEGEFLRWSDVRGTRESTLTTLLSAARFVSRETLRGIAEQLAAQPPMPIGAARRLSDGFE